MADKAYRMMPAARQGIFPWDFGCGAIICLIYMLINLPKWNTNLLISISTEKSRPYNIHWVFCVDMEMAGKTGGIKCMRKYRPQD